MEKTTLFKQNESLFRSFH